MIDCTIIAITSDERFFDLLQRQLRGDGIGSCRMPLVGTIEQACSLLEKARPRLIVLNWSRGCRYAAMNHLLWKTTVFSQPVPVLVFASCYSVDQATRLYRMGVTEYISRNHHEHELGRILDAYVGRDHHPDKLSKKATDESPAGRYISSGSSRSREHRVTGITGRCARPLRRRYRLAGA